MGIWGSCAVIKYIKSQNKYLHCAIDLIHRLISPYCLYFADFVMYLGIVNFDEEVVILT